ncbi:DegT/DnrJ/EryC1/StrS aminotransferase family protein [Synechococcus sp. KORDI-49]|uniref:DegT/DnrJ/EryC1/StrS family aminotransferase n=1 Tax=Synechococcus sp. KORDI-49 TaxID=585423 RepID=UPI0008FFC700|nr:DegT/DnrJ/EryC1/StrS family aminotransferase [Synechococcus sp. KORDI-49]
MDPIYVTKPYLPPFEEVSPLLRQIWDRKILTNSGPNHQLLEADLIRYLGIKNISLFSNGTLALLVALKSLRLVGEVITTPFTFIATANSICWNNLIPVFADIDPITFNLDPVDVEKRINSNTCAILPVHCYGNPCDVKAFEALGENYNLPVVYDASHAFGVEIDNESILNFGEFSTLSFHATKVFNTFEGGAVVSPNLSVKKRLDRLKNFGFVSESVVASNGINAKMSEFSAALGLCQLNYVDKCIKMRRNIAKVYCELLAGVNWLSLPCYPENIFHNTAYFPVRVGLDAFGMRDSLVEHMKEVFEVYPRKYFYPLVYDFPYFSGYHDKERYPLPNATKAAAEVICLPIYPDLSESDISRVVESITSFRC